MSLGEYIGAGSSTTRGLWHLSGNSNDSSGNGFNGTDANISYGLDKGKFGQGANFNGSSSSISVGTSSTLCPSSHSIMGWIYRNAHSEGIWIGKDNDANAAQRAFSWDLYPTSMLYYQFSSSSQYTSVNTSYTWTADTWTHLAITNNAGTFQVYVNGSPITSTVTNNGGSYAAMQGATSTPLYIGRRTSSALWFKGNIDEVIIDGRAWSAAEIKKYYTNSKGRFGIV